MINSAKSPTSGYVVQGYYPPQDRHNKPQVETPKYFVRKALWMRVLAGLLLVGCSPVMLLAMLLVCLTSPGPALFRQTRLGKDGKLFEVLKIRTMYRDAEKLCGPTLCRPGDSRITPVGRSLRFLHLDELPQLINVVRGEMCLIGPRPERPEIILRHRLRETIPGFVERTNVLPGVTGLAQINLPADQTAQCVIPKVKLDLEYIQSANASLDFRILLCTAMRMVGIRHGRAVRLLGLSRSHAVNGTAGRVESPHRNNDGSRWEGTDHPRRKKAPVFAYALSDEVYEASARSLESSTLDSAHHDE
jgi:lipopolysaccharide/colanic/teichoic acid biosynthesis glycosyltransferase